MIVTSRPDPEWPFAFILVQRCLCTFRRPTSSRLMLYEFPFPHIMFSLQVFPFAMFMLFLAIPAHHSHTKAPTQPSIYRLLFGGLILFGPSCRLYCWSQHHTHTSTLWYLTVAIVLVSGLEPNLSERCLLSACLHVVFRDHGCLSCCFSLHGVANRLNGASTDG